MAAAFQPGFMAPPTCMVCGAATARVCDLCGEGFVCGTLCNGTDSLPSEHLISCISHEWSSADTLKGVALGLGQLGPQTQRDFGLDRCTLADRDRLMGVYRLMFVLPGLAAPVLHKWRKERVVRIRLTAMFRGHEDDAAYREHWLWFQRHPELFDGSARPVLPPVGIFRKRKVTAEGDAGEPPRQRRKVDSDRDEPGAGVPGSADACGNPKLQQQNPDGGSA